MKNKLKGFMIDDLKKLENHTIEIIDYIHYLCKQDEFKEEIEEIERFFSYWNTHIKDI
jgi:hypothetical protein